MVKNRLWSWVAEVELSGSLYVKFLSNAGNFCRSINYPITILVGMVVVIILLLSSSVDMMNLLSSLTGESPPFTSVRTYPLSFRQPVLL